MAGPQRVAGNRDAMCQALIAAALHAGDANVAVREALAEPGLGLGLGLEDGPIRCIAIGKASRAMVSGAAAVLGPRLARVLALVPESVNADGDAAANQLARSTLEALVCDHPYPTQRNVIAAAAVERFVREGDPRTPLLVLLSGGASAYLASPAGSLSLDDLASVTRDLQRAGASITELNAVRKHIERLKGGRLAAMCNGPVLALIVSDVIGDRLDVIGSGPVVADPTTYADGLGVLRRRGLVAAHPAVAAHLSRGVAGELEETPKPGDPRLSRVTTRVIASNARVLAGVGEACRGMGFDVVSSRGGLEGSATQIARELVSHAVESCVRTTADTTPIATRRPRAWIAGGEPTVDVRGSAGNGGPSQELALEAARLLAEASIKLWMWVFSTDGRDGPTDAAGAVVDGETWAKIRAAGIDPQRALDEHNSHVALGAAGALIRTGATGTNLNHVWVIAEEIAALASDARSS